VCALVAPPGAPERLTPVTAQAHPFFWSAHLKFLFLQTVSEATVVGYGGRARGMHAARCAAIQRAFCARLRPAFAQHRLGVPFVRQQRNPEVADNDQRFAVSAQTPKGGSGGVGGGAAIGASPFPSAPMHVSPPAAAASSFADAEISWAELFAPPPGLGPAGWHSPLWRQRLPAEYEASYAPAGAGMYSLVRFCRNLYVHGPELVRTRVFSSLEALQAFVLSSWPWLVVELWRVDEALGGEHTRFTLAGGAGGTACGGDEEAAGGDDEEGSEADAEGEGTLCASD